MSDSSVWQIPLGVLAVGVAFAAFLFNRNRASDADLREARAEGRHHDLRAQHERAVEALRNLELEKDKLSAEEYAAQREALLRSGAEALRALEQDSVESVLSNEFLEVFSREQQRLGAGFRTQLLQKLNATDVQKPLLSPEWRGAAWTGGFALVIGMLVWFANSESTIRKEGAPMTGGSSSDAPVDNEQAELLEKVKQDPKDLASLNRLTILALAQQDPSGAMQWNEQALSVAPKDPDARTQRAAIRAMIGMTDDALVLLDEVLAEHPNHGITLFYKGMIAMRAGKPEIAVPALERAVEVQPDPFIQKQLDRARLALQGGTATPPDAPRPGGATTIAEGEITLAEGAQVGNATVLFVNVRSEGGGPPLAALKLNPGPFPQKFKITTADRLPMGGDRPLPPQVQLGIRLDADGNAFTKEGLPGATVNTVAVGSSGLQVELSVQ